MQSTDIEYSKNSYFDQNFRFFKFEVINEKIADLPI